MAHVLIIGMTTSGKSTLAKKLVQIYKRNEPSSPSIVLDPMHDPDWNADFQTENPEVFLREMRSSRGCALFIDEGGQMIGKYSGEMKAAATQSRHFGHKAHFISHGAKDIDKTVRDQCTELYLFRVGFDDAKILAMEYGYPELKDANKLQQGECFKVTRFSGPQLLNVFSD